ncbi:MAG: hypothetical protein U9Q73_02740 [Nanoarchaeota archaeon]|nr:hypothetical protein [Nanoarchaeota archaeon]
MNIKKILLTSLVIWIVTAVLGFLTCGQLFNWVYLLPPNIWKNPVEINFIGSTLFGLFSALLFVFVFAVLYKGIPNEGAKKGMTYGILVWLVSLGGLVGMSFYMTINLVVILYWTIQALVMNIINGMIVGKIYQK